MTAPRPIGPHYSTNSVNTMAAGVAQAFIIDANDRQLRIWNSGATKLYFCTYRSDGTARVASATDCVVPPGDICLITKENHDRLSVFSAGGTTEEHMTGDGW